MTILCLSRGVLHTYPQDLNIGLLGVQRGTELFALCANSSQVHRYVDYYSFLLETLEYQAKIAASIRVKAIEDKS